jgi:hypothetical protein
MLAALQHQRQRLLGADEPRQALGAAGAGQQSEPRLRQAELDVAGIVGRDPVVTGQTELEAAAERGSVDGRGDRLAAGLQRPQAREPRAFGLQGAGRGLFAVGVRRSA